MRKIFWCLAFLGVYSWSGVNTIYRYIFNNNLAKAYELSQDLSTSPNPQSQGSAYNAQSLIWELWGNADSATHKALRAYEVSGNANALWARHHQLLSPLRQADPVFAPRLEQIYQSMVQNHSFHPLRYELHTELLTHYLRSQKPSPAQIAAYMDTLGIVRTWHWVGPFDNTSNGGMHTILAPEYGFDLQDSYKGKDGVQIQWRLAPPTSIYGWTFLDEIQGMENALNFFATSVESPVEQEVCISLGLSGVYSFWVNGKKVAHSTEFHNRGVEGLRLRVAFKKGANDLLLKIGHEASFANFIVRISDSTQTALNLQTLPRGQKAAAQKLVESNVFHDFAPSARDEKTETGKSAENTRKTPHQHSPDAKISEKNTQKGGKAAVSGKITGIGAEKTEISDESAGTSGVYPGAGTKNSLEFSPHSLERRFLQADFYVRNDYFEAAQHALATLRQEFPQSVWVALRTADLHHRQGDYTLGEMEEQRAWNIDSTAAGAWSARLRLQSGDPHKIVELFKNKSPKITPTVDEDFALIKAHIHLGQDSAVWALTEKMYQQSPRHSNALIYAAAVHAVLGEPTDALAMLAGQSSNIIAWPALIYELYDTYKNHGKIDSAIYVLQNALHYHPQNFNHWQRLADLYFLQKKWDLVHIAADSGLAINPQAAELWHKKARTWEMQGQNEAAAQAYEKVLHLGNSNFTISDRILNIRNLTPLKDLRTPWSLDSLQKLRSPTDTAHAEILLNQRTALVHNWGGYEQVLRLVVQVNNHKGVDHWKEFEAWNYFDGGKLEVTKAQTIKADGRVLDADIHYSQVVFKTLEPGDIIEIVMEAKNAQKGALAHHFWLRHYLASQFPTRVAEFALYIDPKIEKNIKMNYHSTPLHTRKIRADLHLNHLLAYNLPGQNYEQLMPHWSDVLPSITVSSLPHWDAINKWYAALSYDKSTPNVEVRALADSLFAGEIDSKEKVRRVHEYIVNNIRYSYQSFRQSGFVPQSAGQTLATRMGDCKDMAVLAKSLLRLGGVASNLVLVNTNDQELQPSLPMIVFNHAILKLASGEFIDFTAGKNSLWTLPFLDQGALKLEIDAENTTDIGYLPFDNSQDRLERVSFDTLDVQGNLTRNLRTLRTGNYASGFRNLYAYESPAASRRLAHKTLLHKYPRVDLMAWQVQNLQNLYAPVQNSSHYRIKNYVLNAENMVLTLPWTDALQANNLPAESQRNFPLLSWKQHKFRGEVVEKISLKLPENFQLSSVPKERRIKNEWVDYSLEFSLKSHVLSATRRLKFVSPRIEKSQYADWRKNLEQIVEYDAQILLLKSASVPKK